MAKPLIEPITDQTLPEFAAFLESNMPVNRAAQDWITGLQKNWCEIRPNYGFLMRDQGKVVGGIGAFYADRVIRGQVQKFCNITSWCVLDSHRKYSMQLAMNVVAQPGYHFTDFSPTKTVAGALQFLKFKAIDEGVAVIPNLPIFPFHGRVVTETSDIAKALSGSMASIWRDHSFFPWLKHLIVGGPEDWCHVIYKLSRFKGMACANIVYVSDGTLFAQYLNRLGWHFFWQGIMTTHIETRVLGRLPMLARVRTGFNPKQFLSQTLESSDIDYLYSETVALDL
jgi:hypothetical protein